MKPIGFSYYTFTGIYIYIVCLLAMVISFPNMAVVFASDCRKRKTRVMFLFVAVSVMHTNALACKINVS